MINNNIQEDYCSFEVSKLLQEKGLDMYWLNSAYTKSGKIINSAGKLLMVDKQKRYNPDIIRIQDKIYAPTHALAIKWIKENFKLWVEIFRNASGWGYIIQKSTNGTEVYNVADFNSPKEATEGALLHIFKNFIP